MAIFPSSLVLKKPALLIRLELSRITSKAERVISPAEPPDAEALSMVESVTVILSALICIDKPLVSISVVMLASSSNARV